MFNVSMRSGEREDQLPESLPNGESDVFLIRPFGNAVGEIQDAVQQSLGDKEPAISDELRAAVQKGIEDTCERMNEYPIPAAHKRHLVMRFAVRLLSMLSIKQLRPKHYEAIIQELRRIVAAYSFVDGAASIEQSA